MTVHTGRAHDWTVETPPNKPRSSGSHSRGTNPHNAHRAGAHMTRTNTHKLTPAEFAVIDTVLTHGGNVVAHMHTERETAAVSTDLLIDMQERGLVRLHGYSADLSGRTRVDVEVRAVACVAFNDEQGRLAGE